MWLQRGGNMWLQRGGDMWLQSPPFLTPRQRGGTDNWGRGYYLIVTYFRAKMEEAKKEPNFCNKN